MAPWARTPFPSAQIDVNARPVDVSLSFADPQDVYHLMRNRRGRMQGELYFRRCHSILDSWTTSYCYINAETRSLRFESESSDTVFQTLINDLRGCKVCSWFDGSCQAAVLRVISRDGTVHLDLRPRNHAQLNPWFAALLCWRPVRGKENIHGTTQRQNPVPTPHHHPGVIQHSASNQYDDENTTIRSEQAIIVDDIAELNLDESLGRNSHREVICTLRGNGEFSIKIVSEPAHNTSLNIRKIPRSAVQRLNASLCNPDRTLAIYPQYCDLASSSSQIRPLYLIFNQRESFEIWFALLRASAIPELYTSQSYRSSDPYTLSDQHPGFDAPASGFLRIQQMLEVRVNKATFDAGQSSTHSTDPQLMSSHNDSRGPQTANCYVEICLDEHAAAKSNLKSDSDGSISWYESHVFHDFSPELSSVTLRIKERQRQRPRTEHSQFSDSALDTSDLVRGEACIEMSEVDAGKPCDRLSPIWDANGSKIGDISLKVRLSQELILMDDEYSPLLGLLTRFGNSLTSKIFQHLPSLRAKLVECFLNIFQASNISISWLRYLAENEVRSTLGTSGSTKTDLLDASSSAMLLASPSANPAPSISREGDVSLLFRGTTLFTRALDSFMKRLGHGYLEKTLGRKLREIVALADDHEVDPSRIENPGDLDSHWEQLKATTEEFWMLIYRSARKCPTELREAFNSIQQSVVQCVPDQWKNVRYTAVSGFLFLRFFCLAISNPQPFGLIKGTILTPISDANFSQPL